MSEQRCDARLSCEDARQLLNARPDLESAAAELETHLTECSACTDFQNLQHVLDRQLTRALVMEPPAWLTASILDELNPAKAVAWWAHPRISLVLQWSFYLLLTGGLVLGLFLPMESVSGWMETILAIPSQLAVAFEVLIAVVGLIPLDTFAGLVDYSAWLYEAVALALVFWWLRQGSSAREQRSLA
jgi:predicted anti-sigma-YlaC factor YlaD